jgi:hypothetical protein
MKTTYYDSEAPEDGILARAIVLSYTELNILIEKGRVALILQVEVYPDKNPSFIAFIREASLSANLYAYKPGKELKVKYDPANIERIAIISAGY